MTANARTSLDLPLSVSEEIKTTAGDAYGFEDMGMLTLKGKSKDVRAFAVTRKDGA